MARQKYNFLELYSDNCTFSFYSLDIRIPLYVYYTYTLYGIFLIKIILPVYIFIMLLTGIISVGPVIRRFLHIMKHLHRKG